MSVVGGGRDRRGGGRGEACSDRVAVMSATANVSNLKAELRSVREMEIAAREEASLVGKALRQQPPAGGGAAAEADVASLLSEIIGHVAGPAEAKEEARKVMMAEAAEGEGQVARLESELQRVTEMSEFQQAEAEAALADVKSLQAAAEEAAKEATETFASVSGAGAQRAVREPKIDE